MKNFIANDLYTREELLVKFLLLASLPPLRSLRKSIVFFLRTFLLESLFFSLSLSPPSPTPLRVPRTLVSLVKISFEPGKRKIILRELVNSCQNENSRRNTRYCIRTNVYIQRLMTNERANKNDEDFESRNVIQSCSKGKHARKK